MDTQALHARGGTIAAIARHWGLTARPSAPKPRGDRVAVRRAAAGDDDFAPFVDYVCARLTEDPHPWTTTMLDELGPLGCPQCRDVDPPDPGPVAVPGVRGVPASEGRSVAVIEHPVDEHAQ